MTSTRLVLTALIATVWATGGCEQRSASVEVGRDLYRQNGCASCHGVEGHGDGSVAATLPTKPRDFRDVSAFKQGADVAQIARTIAIGMAEPGQRRWPGEKHHTQVMPQFDHLSQWERRSLAAFVISLRDDATAVAPPSR